MENKIEKAKKLLETYDQEHIIPLLQKTQGIERERTADRILSIDFEELKELYERAKMPLDIDTSILEPCDAINPNRLTKRLIDSYIKEGVEIITNNKFAVVTMAGGQGTRLRPCCT